MTRALVDETRSLKERSQRTEEPLIDEPLCASQGLSAVRLRNSQSPKNCINGLVTVAAHQEFNLARIQLDFSRPGRIGHLYAPRCGSPGDNRVESRFPAHARRELQRSDGAREKAVMRAAVSGHEETKLVADAFDFRMG